MAENYLQSLISAGADVMSNLYSIEFQGLTDNSENYQLVVRNKDFKGPSFSMGTHTINFGTESLDIPSPSMEGGKSISLSFRLDKNLSIYKLLKKQQEKTLNNEKSYAGTLIPGESSNITSTDSFTINVYALQAPVQRDVQEELNDDVMIKNKKLMYSLKYCWIKKLSGFSFSYDNTDPITITADIAYYKLAADPMSTLLSDGGSN